MKQNNTQKKRSGIPRLLILLALALFLIAYLTLPAVSRPINRAAAVLGSANVDAVVEYIRSFGAYAMVFSFFLMVFSSVAAPLPAFRSPCPTPPSSAGGREPSCPGPAPWPEPPSASSSPGDWAATWWNASPEKAPWPVWKPILKDGSRTVLVCRLLPFVSFDAVSYFAGLTPSASPPFLWPPASDSFLPLWSIPMWAACSPAASNTW